MKMCQMLSFLSAVAYLHVRSSKVEVVNAPVPTSLMGEYESVENCTWHLSGPHENVDHYRRPKMLKYIFLWVCCGEQVVANTSTTWKGKVRCMRGIYIFYFFNLPKTNALHRPCDRTALEIRKLVNQSVVCVGIIQTSSGHYSLNGPVCYF